MSTEGGAGRGRPTPDVPPPGKPAGAARPGRTTFGGTGVPPNMASWLGGKGGKLGAQVRLRPDHKLAIVREMDVATRLRGAREVLGSLTRIVGQAKAA